MQGVLGQPRTAGTGPSTRQLQPRVREKLQAIVSLLGKKGMGGMGEVLGQSGKIQFWGEWDWDGTVGVVLHHILSSMSV